MNCLNKEANLSKSVKFQIKRTIGQVTLCFVFFGLSTINLERYINKRALNLELSKGDFNWLMEKIIKEKISADHLLYVSLKYTKTCDVIVNLLLRWKIMIEMGMERLAEKAKKAKKWKRDSDAPRAQLIQLKKIYAKEPDIVRTLELYEMFRDIEKLEKVRENEFRKGVNLKVNYKGQTVNVNLDALKEYSQILEKFISYLR